TAAGPPSDPCAGDPLAQQRRAPARTPELVEAAVSASARRPAVTGAEELGGRGLLLGLRLLDAPREQRLAGDDQALDLRGALVELHDLRVTHELLDRVLL